MEYNDKQLAEKFEQLPEDLQMAIWDLDLDGVIGAIGWKHKLHIDQVGKLADEIALVLIGAKPITDFNKNLSTVLNLPPEELNALINEVNQEIFLEIRDSLQKVHGGAGEQPIKATGSTIFDEKMSKLFRVPREEVDLDKQLDPYREHTS